MRLPSDYPDRWNLQHEMMKVFDLALDNYREDAQLDPIKKKEIGDYCCNNVLTIWDKNRPKMMILRHIAEEIKSNLKPNDLMEDLSIHSSGYLTLKLSRIWIAQSIHKMLRDGIDPWAPIVYMDNAIIDFSSRNVAGEIDVDHFRSTIIGDTLLRILEFCEVEVILKNHIGHHRGTQIGMLIEFQFETISNCQTIGGFEVFYKKSKKRFHEDAKFRKRAYDALVRLQIGDEKYVNAWAQVCELERKSYQKVYRRVGVHMGERVKRFYLPYIHETLGILRKEGLIEKSEGDEMIFVEEKEKEQHRSIERKKKRLTILKKDEYYNNALTDLTSLRYQVKEEKPDWILYVADVGKEEYIEVCIEAAKRAGWLPTGENEIPKTKFVGYSLVQGDSLNKGRKLVDLLDDAKTRCKAVLVERGNADGWTAEELENTAEALGYGAVKYAHLKDLRVFKYTFDFDEMLNDKGNTGVYLLYKHAEICSIINKSGKDIKELIKTSKLKLEKDEERELGLHLLQFTEILEFACTAVLPDHLCKYLYELSEKFTSFYSVVYHTVGGADEEENILLVCEATRVVMAKCFHLLGITPIDKIPISEKMTMSPLFERDDHDVMDSFSIDADTEEMVSTSSSDEDTEEKVSTSSNSGEDKEDIVSSSSGDQTLEEEEKEPRKYPTPRFQVFSAVAMVENYCAVNKPCLLSGFISVSDLSISSDKDGWIPADDPAFGFVDLFYREWYEPQPIINNDSIRLLSQPRSVPVIDFLDIHMDLFVLGMEDDMFFQVSENYTRISLSDITYDRFSCHIGRGPDGDVELVYIVLSDPVEAALEMTFITHPGDYDVLKQPLSVKICAYYGGAGFDRVYCPSEKSARNITFLQDGPVTIFDKSKIPVKTSVLAVPADGSLVIDVLIEESNGHVIVMKILDFPAKRKGSSDGRIDGLGCSIELKVNWKCDLI